MSEYITFWMARLVAELLFVFGTMAVIAAVFGVLLWFGSRRK